MKLLKHKYLVEFLLQHYKLSGFDIKDVIICLNYEINTRDNDIDLWFDLVWIGSTVQIDLVFRSTCPEKLLQKKSTCPEET